TFVKASCTAYPKENIRYFSFGSHFSHGGDGNFIIGALHSYQFVFRRWISLAQLNLSSLENAQGAPLFSMFENMTASCEGTLDSSITRFLRMSTMNGTWSIFTGH